MIVKAIYIVLYIALTIQFGKCPIVFCFFLAFKFQTKGSTTNAAFAIYVQYEHYITNQKTKKTLLSYQNKENTSSVHVK